MIATASSLKRLKEATDLYFEHILQQRSQRKVEPEDICLLLLLSHNAQAEPQETRVAGVSREIEHVQREVAVVFPEARVAGQSRTLVHRRGRSGQMLFLWWGVEEVGARRRPFKRAHEVVPNLWLHHDETVRKRRPTSRGAGQSEHRHSAEPEVQAVNPTQKTHPKT